MAKAGKKKTFRIKCPTCGGSMTFNPAEVTYTFIPSPESDLDYREEFAHDPELIERIEKAFKDGDEWAWTDVECRAEWHGFTGSAFLGGCSLYDGEKDFVRCNGKDMKTTALEFLLAQICREGE